MNKFQQRKKEKAGFSNYLNWKVTGESLTIVCDTSVQCTQLFTVIERSGQLALAI